MKQELHQASEFFKSEPVYDKLFKAFRKKYESLGRIGGTVSVKEFSKTELEELGKFFGLPGERLEMKGSVSLGAFEKQIEHTRFSSIQLKPLLDAYFGETIISKKEQKLVKEANLRQFLNNQQKQYPRLASWITYLLEQKREGRWILQIAEKDPTHFESLLESLNRAILYLPQRAERLPMFSQRMTGDPHAFDIQTDLGRMLIHVLTIYRAETTGESEIEIPTSTEGVNQVLEYYQIYRDDLLNFVTCANLVAQTDEGDHPVWVAAAKQKTVQIVPLRELIPLDSTRPVKGNVVWVVENSGVCATLLDYEPDISIICTNGQFTLATLMLMDTLAKSGNVLYYAGDFDPEGLGMAQRLLERYSDSVCLWHMDKAAYHQTKPINELSQERLEKLKRINHEDLIEVAEEMQQIKKAGYQEALVEWMLDDIRNGALY